MNPVLEYLNKVDLSSDLSIPVQLFLQHMEKWMCGYTQNDIQDMGKVMRALTVSGAPNSLKSPMTKQLSTENFLSVVADLVEIDSQPAVCLLRAVNHDFRDAYDSFYLPKSSSSSIEQENRQKEVSNVFDEAVKSIAKSMNRSNDLSKIIAELKAFTGKAISFETMLGMVLVLRKEVKDSNLGQAIKMSLDFELETLEKTASMILAISQPGISTLLEVAIKDTPKTPLTPDEIAINNKVVKDLLAQHDPAVVLHYFATNRNNSLVHYYRVAEDYLGQLISKRPDAISLEVAEQVCTLILNIGKYFSPLNYKEMAGKTLVGYLNKWETTELDPEKQFVLIMKDICLLISAPIHGILSIVDSLRKIQVLIQFVKNYSQESADHSTRFDKSLALLSPDSQVVFESASLLVSDDANLHGNREMSFFQKKLQRPIFQQISSMTTTIRRDKKTMSTYQDWLIHVQKGNLSWKKFAQSGPGSPVETRHQFEAFRLMFSPPVVQPIDLFTRTTITLSFTLAVMLDMNNGARNVDSYIELMIASLLLVNEYNDVAVAAPLVLAKSEDVLLNTKPRDNENLVIQGTWRIKTIESNVCRLLTEKSDWEKVTLQKQIGASLEMMVRLNPQLASTLVPMINEYKGITTSVRRQIVTALQALVKQLPDLSERLSPIIKEFSGLSTTLNGWVRLGAIADVLLVSELAAPLRVGSKQALIDIKTITSFGQLSDIIKVRGFLDMAQSGLASIEVLPVLNPAELLMEACDRAKNGLLLADNFTNLVKALIQTGRNISPILWAKILVPLIVDCIKALSSTQKPPIEQERDLLDVFIETATEQEPSADDIVRRCVLAASSVEIIKENEVSLEPILSAIQLAPDDKMRQDVSERIKHVVSSSPQFCRQLAKMLGIDSQYPLHHLELSIKNNLEAIVKQQGSLNAIDMVDMTPQGFLEVVEFCRLRPRLTTIQQGEILKYFSGYFETCQSTQFIEPMIRVLSEQDWIATSAWVSDRLENIPQLQLLDIFVGLLKRALLLECLIDIVDFPVSIDKEAVQEKIARSLMELFRQFPVEHVAMMANQLPIWVLVKMKAGFARTDSKILHGRTELVMHEIEAAIINHQLGEDNK